MRKVNIGKRTIEPKTVTPQYIITVLIWALINIYLMISCIRFLPTEAGMQGYTNITHVICLITVFLTPTLFLVGLFYLKKQRKPIGWVLIVTFLMELVLTIITWMSFSVYTVYTMAIHGYCVVLFWQYTRNNRVPKVENLMMVNITVVLLYVASFFIFGSVMDIHYFTIVQMALVVDIAAGAFTILVFCIMNLILPVTLYALFIQYLPLKPQ